MTPLDRFVIFIASVFMVLAGLTLAISAFGWNPAESALSMVGFVNNHRIESGIGGLLLLLAGWHLGFFSLASTKERGIVRDTPLGQVRIQYRALENLVVRSAQEVEGIRDVEGRISAEGDEVTISVSLSVLPEFKIPDLSDRVQQKVEEAVREVAGVPVASVSVEVRSLAGHPKAQKSIRSRVE